MNGLIVVNNNQGQGMRNNNCYAPNYNYYGYETGYLYNQIQQQVMYQQQMQQQAIYEAQLRQAVMEQEQQRMQQQAIYQQQQIQYGYQQPLYREQSQPQEPVKDDIIFSLSVDPNIYQQIFIDNSTEMVEDTTEPVISIGEIFQPTEEEIADRKRKEKGAKYITKQIKRWLSDKFNPEYDKLSFPVIKYLDEMKCTIEQLIANHTMYGLDVVMW